MHARADGSGLAFVLKLSLIATDVRSRDVFEGLVILMATVPSGGASVEEYLRRQDRRLDHHLALEVDDLGRGLMTRAWVSAAAV